MAIDKMIGSMPTLILIRSRFDFDLLLIRSIFVGSIYV